MTASPTPRRPRLPRHPLSGLVMESFAFLLSGAVFQKLPREWLTPATETGLAELSNFSGAWFESVVVENMKKLGIGGLAYKKQISAGQDAVIIPSSIGQIDFLGVSERERLVVLCECKMVDSGLEPKYYRDELSQFVRAKSNYSDKFRKKIDWAWQKREAIARALRLPGSVPDMAFALVTMYPSFASYFIQDFPCVSITELMLNYEAAGSWPYTLGRRT